MARRSKRPDAIPNLRVRVKHGKTYYSYCHGGKDRKETALGSNYAEAIRRWAEFQAGDARHARVSAILTIVDVANRYRAEVIPRKAPNTQKENAKELAKLLEFFGDPPVPLDELRPLHVRQYLDWRTKKGTTAKSSANREKALLSHMWNKARAWGLTDGENPCKGITGFSEPGRDVYVEDEVYAAVWQAADEPLRDAMDLAYLTGQRPADTRKFDLRDIRDGQLAISQNKTGAKLRIAVEGELAQVLERITARKRGYVLTSTRLVVDERGQPLSHDQLRYRFDKARRLAGVEKSAYQFRDLRAKAGTDKADSSGDIRQAQAQLGHASVTMTEQYVRARKGSKVTPTR